MNNQTIILKTANFNNVFALCKEAHLESKMVGIIGYPGAGKTTALNAYSKKNHNVYYARVTASMSARHFYSQILLALGKEGTENGVPLHDLINEISYRLNYNTNKKLLIIDEAGKFKPKFLEYMHELRDNTSSNVGIILSGPEYFYKNITRWANKGIVGIPEILRRIDHWQHLSPPTTEEKEAICKAYKITLELDIKNISDECNSFSDLRRNIIEFLFVKNKK